MTAVFPEKSTKIRLALPSGRVDPFDMTPADVKLRDILHCLPEQARFNGYTRKHYSVAQHSVLVARLAAVDHGDSSPITRAALIHDAVETYTGDVVLPLKRRMPEFLELEGEVEPHIWRAFGLQYTRGPFGLVEQVKRYDRMACTLECQQLLFYMPEEWVSLEIGLPFRRAAKPLMRFMSPEKARRLLKKEFKRLDLEGSWAPIPTLFEREGRIPS